MPHIPVAKSTRSSRIPDRGARDPGAARLVFRTTPRLTLGLASGHHVLLMIAGRFWGIGEEDTVIGMLVITAIPRRRLS